MKFTKIIFIFIFLLSSNITYSGVFFASRSFNIGKLDFISWHVEKTVNNQNSSRCYKKFQDINFDTFQVEIGFSCQSEEKFLNWINLENKSNLIELTNNLHKIKRLIDYLFKKKLPVKFRLILTFENSTIKKNFFYVTSKYIPINIIAQFGSNEVHETQSYANLASSTIHEITHLYQKKFIKNKFNQSSGQTQEAVAEIAGSCGLVLMGELGLEDVFTNSFKNDFRNNISALDSLMKSNYGKMILKTHPKTFSRSVGYIKGRYALWSIFGESIQDKKESNTIFKFCKYVIHEMPDIDTISISNKKLFLKLDTFMDGMDIFIPGR